MLVRTKIIVNNHLMCEIHFANVLQFISVNESNGGI
jgi:hypothetical protein